MDFIQTSNKAVDLFGAGKHGFGVGNPSTGVLATFFSADWANNVQQELVNAIEGAGIPINPSKRIQLLEAIHALITARFSGSHQSLGPNGFQELPGEPGNRLILQWGLASSNSSGVAAVTFPISFPSTVLLAIGMHIGGDSAVVSEVGGTRTASGVQLLIKNLEAEVQAWSIAFFALGK